MNRLCDVLVFGGLITLTAGTITFPWLIAAGAIAIAAGLWTDPQETEEQRQYRHAQRKPDKVDQLIAAHHRDEDFARWETEYCDSRPLPGTDTARWDG